MNSLHSLPTPTATQLLHLTAQLPVAPTPRPNIQNLLQSFLNVCRTQWISDFLFTQDPVHIPHLASSSLSLTSFTCDLTTTRVQPPTLHPDPNHLSILPDNSHHIHSRLLFTPAVTLNHITVGVGVVEGLTNLGTPWLPIPFSYTYPLCLNFRFVRDAANRKLLFVNDVPEQDCILIYYSQHHSPTECNGFTARFSRSKLLAAIAETSGLIYVHRILPALQYIIEDTLHRVCPICNAHWLDECRCQFPILQSRHPFDTKYFRDAFMQCLGTFQGVSSKVLNPYAKGITALPSHHINLGVRVSHTCVTDFDLMERLRGWAISGHLRGKTQDPRESVIFGRYGESSRHADWYGREEAVGSAVQMIEDCNGSTGDVSGPLAELLAIFSENPNSQERRPPTPRKKKRNRNHHVSSSEFTPGIDLISAVWDSVQGDNVVSDDLSKGNRNHGRQFQQQESQQDGLEPSLDHRRQSIIVSPAVQGKRRDRNEASTLRAEVPIHVSSDDSTIDQPPPCSTIVVDALSDAEDVSAIVKRMKAEERKIRNRASAHRSNMRNKAVKEALENELRVARERVVQLRSKETVLRRENLKLRKTFVGR